MSIKFDVMPYEGNNFEPFSIRIDISNAEELLAFTSCVGHAHSGHGTKLYEFLEKKCREAGVLT